MLKFYFVSIFGLLSTIHLSAQTYYTGWDTQAEVMGWTQVKKGDNGIYDWNFESGSFISPDSALVHYYPVGGTIPTDDWFISPVFDFDEGGQIGSLWKNLGGLGLPMTGDSIALYLLNGSSDPDLATKTILYNYADSTFLNDAVWRKDSNINIPPTTGSSYLAFRYYTTNNWLDVKFDNLTLTYFSNTGNINKNQINTPIKTFPNPVSSTLTIDFGNIDQKTILDLNIININGQVAQKLSVNEQFHHISGLENGLYFLQIITPQGNRAKKIIIAN
jgi:hypothetical protein